MAKKIISGYRIEVVCVGSELLLNRVNTDVNLISGILARAGLNISFCCLAGDDKKEIIRALDSSLKRSDIVFVTGGLGPTSDDITRESISELLNRKLLFSEEVWKEICKRFYDRGIREFPEINKKQAYVIENSKVLKNEVGTAPGLVVREGEKEIVVLPGPPSELAPMAEKYVDDFKKKHRGEFLQTYRFGISGTPESTVEEVIYPFLHGRGIRYTILAQPQVIELLIVSSSIPRKQIKEIEVYLKEKFNENYLGLNPPTLPEIVGDLLREKKWRITLAESCTGGLAGKLLTDIPGSSDFFQGSFVTYGNLLKKKALKVPKTTLKKYGAVSEETALYMAKGAKKAGKSDVSLSFTGIAGPSGGTAEKPVGLVYIGIGLPKNRFYTFRFLFPGNRQRIRERAVYQGLNILRRCLMGKLPSPSPLPSVKK
jgi:nicotinamide-nucleotide amidase